MNMRTKDTFHSISIFHVSAHADTEQLLAFAVNAIT